jgi:two-component system phosphate regulon sensor histidine kinase PhoR
MGNRDEMSEVLHNLLDNAIKYGDENSKVKLILETDGSNKNVKISVVNSGEGIDEIHLPRLTERFYRIDKARTRKLGGTGLGLAIVKHIVNRHRGRLQIISEGNGEVVFIVYFPIIRV